VSDATDAEATDATQLTAFDSDGFSLGSGTVVNGTSATFVGWNWKAGGTASTNTEGSVDTSVSANTTAGFSICTYTSDGNTTAGHGLSQAPELIIIKRRDTGADWIVGGVPVNPDAYWQYGLKLNSTVAAVDETAWFGYQTATTATTFPLGNSAQTNTSGGTYVAYCFHSVEGYSKVGSYKGNGNSDGPFIYTGFRPAWVFIKKSSASGDDWYQFDNKRETYNPVDKRLVINGTQAAGSGNPIDFLSNGIKVRDSSASFNGSGTTMIYMVFAAEPFKTTNAW